MFERKISEDDVRHVVRSGQVIEEYVDDKPFPSREENQMKCMICKQGETKSVTTTVTLEREETTLVMRLVPARVCKNCGEAYLDDKMTSHLLKTAEQIAKAGVQVEVRDYKAA